MSEDRVPPKPTQWFYCVHCEQSRLGDHVSTKTYHETGEIEKQYKCPRCSMHSVVSSGGK